MRIAVSPIRGDAQLQFSAESSCEGKREYKQRVAKQLAAERMKKDGVQRLVYKCPYCRHWHITSKAYGEAQ